MDFNIFFFEDSKTRCEDKNIINGSMLIDIKVLAYIQTSLTKNDINFLSKEINNLKWQYNEYNNNSKQVTRLSTFNSSCNMSMLIMSRINMYTFNEGVDELIKIKSNLNKQSRFPNTTEYCRNSQINTTLYTANDNETNDILHFDSMVCFDNVRKTSTTSSAVDFDLVLVIATYCGLGLSNVCLLTAIFINKHFLPRFTTPGGNVENVMLSILLSQIIFMIGIGANDNKHVCFVMGVIVHYSIICVYVCMTLSVLHISKTFVSLVKNPARETQNIRKLRVKMTLLSCIIPSFIVVPCVIMDLFFYTTFSIGYTLGGTCFPTAFPANIIVVSGPILTCLLLNFVFVFAIMVSIFRLAANFRPWYNRLHIPVLMKLFLFTGLPWLFGILSEFLNNDTLRVVFVGSYSLQGFCVALAWTCNRRVLRSLRKAKETTTPSSSYQTTDSQVTTGM